MSTPLSRQPGYELMTAGGLGPAVLFTKNIEEKVRAIQSLVPPDGTVSMALKGQGFLTVSTVGGAMVEHPTLEAAKEAAEEMLDRGGAVAIYEAVAYIRPKRDVVGRFTERGQQLLDASRQLSAGEEVK